VEFNNFHTLLGMAINITINQYLFIEKLTNHNLNIEMQKLVIHKQYKDKTKEKHHQ